MILYPLVLVSFPDDNRPVKKSLRTIQHFAFILIAAMCGGQTTEDIIDMSSLGVIAL